MGFSLRVVEAEPGQLDRKLQRLLDYWQEKRGEREMPARADIDASEIPDLLPNIYLIDVSYDPNIFRFRLAGTEIIRLFSEEVSGKTTDQLEAVALRSLLRSHYEEVIEARAPVSDDDAFVDRRKSYAYDWLLLPLSSGGRVVDMLLGCCVARSSHGRRR